MNKTQREALRLLRAVAPRRATIPILTHALLTPDGARVTNLDGVEAEVSAEALGLKIGGTGALAVADLKIAIEAGAEWLLIEGERCKWSGGEFVTLPASDFPTSMIGGEAQPDAVHEADGLPAALAVVACAMSPEAERYSLHGTALAARGRVVASDGHRLHLAQGPDLDLPETFIVPAPAVKLLAAWKGALTVERYRDVLRFVGEAGSLTARRLEGMFPNFEKVFPTDKPHVWSVAAPEFLTATAAAYKYSNKQNHATRIEANGALSLVAAGADAGEMRASVALTGGVGLPVTFGMNLGYLRDAVEAVGGDGRVSMELGKGSGGLVGSYEPGALHLRGAHGEAVIMPMRI